MLSNLAPRKFSEILLRFSTIALLPVAYVAQAGPYTGYTTSSLIKWRDTSQDVFDFTNPPHVSVWFSSTEAGTDLSSRYKILVDTGSCGTVVAQEKVKLLEREKVPANRAWQYLSSSSILYTGWWVERYVWFNHDPADIGNQVKSKLKVLAMDQKYVECKDWTPADEDECPDPSIVSVYDPETQILGISFGRTYDGQPLGTPDKNVFLNINSMASGSMSAFYPGWIIDMRGITVGLTDGTWGGFAQFEVPLGRDPGAPPPGTGPPPPRHHFAWGEVPGCVFFPGIPGSTCIEFSAVLDTGMDPDHASLRMPRATVDILRPSGSGSQQLPDGKTVDIRLGRMSRPPRSVEIFSTPDSPPHECDITPDYANIYYDPPGSTVRFPFANTGRHIFRRWAQGFDPWRGIAGFLQHKLPPQLTGGTHACPLGS